MNQIDHRTIGQMATMRYRNLSDPYFWDSEFSPWESDAELEAALKAFHRSMWKVWLRQWIKGKLDCEDWARTFVSHVIIRNALSGNPLPKSLGVMTYDIGGDPQEHHAIAVAVVKNYGGGYVLREVEAQPGGGIVHLTPKERDTAKRFSV